MKRTLVFCSLGALAALALGTSVGTPSPAGAAPVSVSFGSTGATQSFVVPPGITELRFELCGASGGSVGAATGGRGARVSGVLAVTPGETLVVEVGSRPTGTSGLTGGYNGGGDGPQGRQALGIGGGGATDLRRGGSATTDRIRVAGGGGGGGYSAGTATNAGGDGGAIGADGLSTSAGGAGHGGTTSAGGAGGIDGSSSASAGGAGQGGAGSGSGSGGGGGYYGGGGGAGEVILSVNDGGGGGGGSSLADPSDTVIAGGCTGDGSAVLSYDVQVTTSTTSTTSSTTTTTTAPTPPAGPRSPRPGPWAPPPAAPVRSDPTFTG